MSYDELRRQYSTCKNKDEQKQIGYQMMYASARQKVDFWLSIGLLPADALAKARTQSTAGCAVWEQIERELVT